MKAEDNKFPYLTLEEATSPEVLPPAGCVKLFFDTADGLFKYVNSVAEVGGFAGADGVDGANGVALLVEDEVTGYPERDVPEQRAIFVGTTDPGVLLEATDVWLALDADGFPATTIVVDPTGLDHITATNVQAALAELDAAITAAGVGGLDAESVRDLLATVLVAGTNVTITPDDGADTVTISASGGGGGGSSETLTEVKTANYAAAVGEFVPVDASGAARTVTLPAAPSTGARVRVKKVDTSANKVVVTSAADLIDGHTAMWLVADGSALEVVYDGDNWLVASDAGGVVPVGPTFVGAELTYVNNVNTVNAALPAGAAAGQLAVIHSGHGYDANTPSGATSFGTESFWKVLTSGDITNGYITVTWPTAYYGMVGVVTVSGANAAPVRGATRAGTSSTAAQIAMAGSFVAEPGDLILYFAHARYDSGVPATLVLAFGTTVDTQISAKYSGVIAHETAAAAKVPSNTATGSPNPQTGSEWLIVAVKA